MLSGNNYTIILYYVHVKPTSPVASVVIKKLLSIFQVELAGIDNMFYNNINLIVRFNKLLNILLSSIEP